MSRIEKFQIIDVSEREDRLMCGICLAIFVDPRVMQCCRQTYCYECIGKWLENNIKCPNCRKTVSNEILTLASLIVTDTLSRLTLSCLNFNNGCPQQISYDSYRKHVNECPYSPEAVCGDCGERNGNRAKHNCVKLLAAKFPCIKKLSEESSRDRISLLVLNKQYNEVLNENTRFVDTMKQLTSENESINTVWKRNCDELLSKNATLMLEINELKTICENSRNQSNTLTEWPDLIPH